MEFASSWSLVTFSSSGSEWLQNFTTRLHIGSSGSTRATSQLVAHGCPSLHRSYEFTIMSAAPAASDVIQVFDEVGSVDVPMSVILEEKRPISAGATALASRRWCELFLQGHWCGK